MAYNTVSETVNAYNDYINEVNEPVRVAGITFDPARVLAEIDPIAYKCGWIDWCDFEGIDTDDLEDDYTFTRDSWQ